MKKITLLHNPKSSSAKQTIVALKKIRASFHLDLQEFHDDCTGGEYLFALSYPFKIPQSVIDKYDYPMVLHGSNLPAGRGWSPVFHEILAGRTEFTMSLARMASEIDAGDLVLKKNFAIEKTYIYSDITAAIASVQATLILSSLELDADELMGKPQEGVQSFYPKLTPSDSEINVDVPIAEQWDRLRVADPQRHPSFFRMYGTTFILTIERWDNHDN